MQQELEVIEVLGSQRLNTTTIIAKSVDGNGIELQLQVTINHKDKHLLDNFMKKYLSSRSSELKVGSIIQLNIKHRFQPAPT